MLSPEEIKIKLQDRNLKVVAEKTGLHQNTVYKFAKGGDSSSKFITVKKLSDYLTSN